jgi:hypothetical protein
MTTRNVVVAMPFGRGETERRKGILNFRRIKYIVEERCQVVPAVPPGSSTRGMRVAYDVDVAKTAMDIIPEKALTQIYNADILIALLSEHNLTVTFELGYRRARERRPVILVVDSEDDVPIHERAVAYQSWRQDEVLAEIDDIAGKNYPQLAGFQVDIPGALKDVIDARDDVLIRGLELALQEIEADFVVLAPDPVQKLRGMLDDAITRYYAFSVVAVRFSKNGEFEDPTAPAEVVDFDEEFSHLYGYAGKNTARQDQPLTLDLLLDRIKKFSDTDDWNKFLQEQVILTETVIKDGGFARATVPIRFNSSHAHSQFRCKSFLPCMCAQVTDANTNGPHRMYVLIAYIEVPNGAAPLSTGGEG